MKKIKWNDVRLVLMLGLVIFLYSFSSKRNESRKLKGADIEFTDNENFITLEKVNKLLIQNYGNVMGIEKVKLDLGSVEKTLDKNPMIQNAEVFATVDGKLKAVITQRKPIARVYDGDSSYYIDYEGRQMPLSENYTARVPLVSGDINRVGKKQLHELLRYIYDDDFLKKNIIGIEVNPSGGVVMKNRNYDCEIFLGSVVSIDRKFNNYKAFFQDAIQQDTLIEQYKTINLKFTQQVVCTKK